MRMSVTTAVRRTIWLVAMSVMLASCVSSAPAVAASRKRLPVSEAGRTLSLRVVSHNLGPGRVNVLVFLRATETLARVTVRVGSPSPRVHVRGHCQYTPLHSVVSAADSPGFATRRHPNPLPVVPFCSFVVSARKPGRYPLDIFVSAARGVDLVAPIHTLVEIPATTP